MFRVSALVAPLFAAMAFLVACPYGDVGAPCNHGNISAPTTQLVTFPALSCDQLLCVYATAVTLPEGSCASDVECIVAGGSNDGEDNAECVIKQGQNKGRCRLRMEHVLERSMCSRKCETDVDCTNDGDQHRPAAKETNCELGFKCARIQRLGEFCCKKMCVCQDDLYNTDEIDQECEQSDICTRTEE